MCCKKKVLESCGYLTEKKVVQWEQYYLRAVELGLQPMGVLALQAICL